MHQGESIAELEKALLERPIEGTKCVKILPDHMYYISMNSVLSAGLKKQYNNSFYDHQQKALMKIKDYHAQTLIVYKCSKHLSFLFYCDYYPYYQYIRILRLLYYFEQSVLKLAILSWEGQ